MKRLGLGEYGLLVLGVQFDSLPQKPFGFGDLSDLLICQELRKGTVEDGANGLEQVWIKQHLNPVRVGSANLG